MPPTRRTTTIKQVIKESKPIIKENLAPTRSKKVKMEPVQQTTKQKNKKQDSPKSPEKVIGSPELPSKKARTKSEKIQDKINSKTAKKQNNQNKSSEEEKQNDAPKKSNSEPEQIITPEPVIPKQPKKVVDIVFCCDTTASMGSYLEQTKEVVTQIIIKLKEKADENLSVQFGFVCYRDHPPQEISYLTKVQDLCNETEIKEFIEQQSAKGGGDAPEAVLDGLYEAATNIKWREEENGKYFRYVFHIADQPPHGKEFGIQSQFEDGVPSGVTLEKVAKEMNSKNIRYKLIKANRTYSLERMIKLFKESFSSFEETDLSDATKIDHSITEIILKDLN